MPAELGPYLRGQRMREFGVHMAMGAQRRDLIELALGQGARLVGLGLAICLPAALALSRMRETLLFNVATTDLLTLLARGDVRRTPPAVHLRAGRD